MDSLTQIILGAAVGNAIAGRKIGNKAILYGAIAGTIPDLDILSVYITDPITAVEVHRGFTHSILFALFGGAILGYLMYLIERKNKVTIEEGFWLFFWGFFTHALLDMFTTWGTRLLWPFDYSFAFKSIFVIDPLYTVPFAYFLIRSMREKIDMNKRMYYNRMGFYVSSTYLFITLALKAFAFYSFTDALSKQGIKYTEMSVKPTVMNTILWNAIVETEDSFLIGEYSFFDHSPITFQEFPKNKVLIKSLENHPLIVRLVDISEGYYTFSEKKEEIYFNDLRFGLLKNEGEEVQFAFSYRFYLDNKGELQAEEVKKDRKDGVKLLKKLWVRLQGI
ncbi:metal-dependent hydrolase [Myroides marinus]|uniref:metal-dependent hydrolase n=1 Tax=Myroides TaxID=76831 RepID=UPI002578B6C2|nr:metal-dependent hydrolase [Myroides marinus]MDM1350120.1 metal-dependent hydrolase [Myroides marinus]MDM1357261.1 metal-dependent hydrolase [Myroides marinus]MDM1362136.1 metal-dependent hydrolase [Myroides marinus]MDM1364227.1 metal-dependent hydrolase [Myroides marinus]MDM1403627.1 metal-dependent hydrolase [Myroides marinus]